MRRLDVRLICLWLVIAGVCIVPSAFAAGLAEPVGANAVTLRHAQMVYPTVLVSLAGPSGSGTVIYSAQRDGEWHSYVLTNHHVIARNIDISEQWDPQAGKNRRVETRTPLELKWYTYNELSKPIGNSAKRARIVAWTKDHDLALLRIADTERGVDHVAHLLPQDEPLHLTERVWAVGAGLGRPPFATSGHVSLVDDVLDGLTWTLASAPIIFGNSGGGLFRWSECRHRYELVGVPSRVAVAGFATVVESMGIAIPMERVYGFLERNCYGPIVALDLPDTCESLGEVKKEAEK